MVFIPLAFAVFTAAFIIALTRKAADEAARGEGVSRGTLQPVPVKIEK